MRLLSKIGPGGRASAQQGRRSSSSVSYIAPLVLKGLGVHQSINGLCEVQMRLWGEIGVGPGPHRVVVRPPPNVSVCQVASGQHPCAHEHYWPLRAITAFKVQISLLSQIGPGGRASAPQGCWTTSPNVSGCNLVSGGHPVAHEH